MFIEGLLDIYREVHGPIHYSLVAKRLRLSKYTAYDMLRLLEEKGYVEALYRTQQAGPGRASVLFQPTLKARDAFGRLAGDDATVSWERTKDRVIDKIAAGDFDDAKLAQELLDQIDDDLDDVAYCSKVIGDLMARFRARARHRTKDSHASIVLALIEGRNTHDLRLLPGFLMGLVARDDDAAELARVFLDRIRKYEVLLDHMDKEGRRRLEDTLTAMTRPLQSEEASMEL